VEVISLLFFIFVFYFIIIITTIITINFFLIKGAKGVSRNKTPKQNIALTGNMGSKYADTGDASTDMFGAALRYAERT
jgi:hypothetical protein